MSKVLGIISIKGGVGKTTTVSNLGTILSRDFNKKVLLVDANFSAPNLGMHLGVVAPEKTLHDVLLNNIKTSESIYEHELGFHVILGSLINKKIDVYRLKKKISEIKDYYDIVLLDTSPNFNHEILSSMIASDDLLVVLTPDYPTLATTLSVVKIAKQKKINIVGLVLNRVLNKKFELSVEDIESLCNCPVLAVLPNEIKIIESLNLTKPAAIHTPLSNAIVEYKKLAASLIGEEYHDKRLRTKIINLFRKKENKVDKNRKLRLKQI